MIKILIADDHAIVREGLNKIIQLEEDMRVVGMAKDSPEAIKIVMSESIDVAILDISMPGKSGLDLIRDFQNHQQGIKVIILSMYSDERFGMRALKSGASSYLTKEIAPNLIITAIRTVYSGRKYITPSLAEKIADELQEPSEKRPHERLSDREFEVMLMIAGGKRVIEIAEALSLSESTVSTYRTRILEKTNMKTNADIIHYCIMNGLVE